MINSNVIEILKTFTDEDMRSFEEFLESPFHNKNTVVIKFFKLLRMFHPDYSSPSLTKENLFQGMYGNENYKESYIRNLFSDLNILAEKYLAIIGMDNKMLLDRVLIDELHRRQLTNLVFKKLKKFEKDNERNLSRDENYYLNKVFQYGITSHLVVENSLLNDFRKDEMNAKIKHFILSIITSSFSFLVEEQRVNIKHDYNFLKQILEYVKINISEFNDSPLLMIYYSLWQSFFGEDTDKYFQEAKRLFKKHFNSLERVDKKNCYSIMQTYYVIKMENGFPHYEKELLHFLMEMLKTDVLTHKEKGNINLNLYRNILIMCYKYNETAILTKFIKDYINHVSEARRESIKAYSDAHLSCLKKNYEEALMISGKIDFNDLLKTTNENLFFKLDIRNLMLICYYELKSFENALFHIDSYRRFLSNSKLIKDRLKNKYMKFLQLTNELIKLNFKFDDYKLKLFKKKLLNTTNVISHAWLTEKAEEMEKAAKS